MARLGTQVLVRALEWPGLAPWTYLIDGFTSQHLGAARDHLPLEGPLKLP